MHHPESAWEECHLKADFFQKFRFPDELLLLDSWNVKYDHILQVSYQLHYLVLQFKQSSVQTIDGRCTGGVIYKFLSGQITRPPFRKRRNNNNNNTAESDPFVS